jgi:hypothetical protein
MLSYAALYAPQSALALALLDRLDQAQIQSGAEGKPLAEILDRWMPARRRRYVQPQTVDDIFS